MAPPSVSIIPPPPPISLPVWSLACSTLALRKQNDNDDTSNNVDDDHHHHDLPTTSMNIVTFCSAVSVAPPKLWIVSLYYNTLTKDAFLANGYGILQLLKPTHKVVVPILGKRSGYDTNYSKRTECQILGYDWITTTTTTTLPDTTTNLPDDKSCSSIDLLPDCATYLYLKVRTTIEAGDHIVAMCEVVQTYQWNPTSRRIEPTTTTTTTSTTSTTQDCTTTATSLDPISVLYTGQLRQEGII